MPAVQPKPKPKSKRSTGQWNTTKEHDQGTRPRNTTNLANSVLLRATSQRQYTRSGWNTHRMHGLIMDRDHQPQKPLEMLPFQCPCCYPIRSNAFDGLRTLTRTRIAENRQAFEWRRFARRISTPFASDQKCNH